MRDVVFVVLTVGFFGVAAAVVRLCDWIVGPDPLERPADRAEDVDALT